MHSFVFRHIPYKQLFYGVRPHNLKPQQIRYLYELVPDVVFSLTIYSSS